MLATIFIEHLYLARIRTISDDYHLLFLVQWSWSKSCYPELLLKVSLCEVPNPLSREAAAGTIDEVWTEGTGEHEAEENNFCAEPACFDDRNGVAYTSEEAIPQGTSAPFWNMSSLPPCLTSKSKWEESPVEQVIATAADEKQDSPVPQPYESVSEAAHATQFGFDEVKSLDHNHMPAPASTYRAEVASQTAADYELEDPAVLVHYLAPEADYDQQAAVHSQIWQLAAQKEWAVEAASMVLLGGVPRSKARTPDSITPPHVFHNNNASDVLRSVTPLHIKSTVFAPLEVRVWKRPCPSITYMHTSISPPPLRLHSSPPLCSMQPLCSHSSLSISFSLPPSSLLPL
jgi:hypothetical protein